MATIGKRLGLVAALAMLLLLVWPGVAAAQLSERSVRPLPNPAPSSFEPNSSSAITRGARLFQTNCGSCHTADRSGPTSLRGVFNAGAGQRKGTYPSNTLKYSGKVWNETQLDAFLADPARNLPGTQMQGGKLTDARDRRDVIAFLMTLQ